MSDQQIYQQKKEQEGQKQDFWLFLVFRSYQHDDLLVGTPDQVQNSWYFLGIIVRVGYKIKRQFHKFNKLLKLKQKLVARNEKKYKVETICKNEVYIKETLNQFLELHYLISWKDYSEDEGIW